MNDETEISDKDLARLIQEGADSGEISEEEFWRTLKERTSKLLAEYEKNHLRPKSVRSKRS
jgi:hypothetical protein